MSTTPNDQAGLQKYIDELKAQGKTESTSKSLAKAVIKLKQFTPSMFDLEAGGGNKAILQRGVEDPTPEGMGTSKQSGLGFSGNMGVSGMSGDVNLQQIYDDAINTPEIQGLEGELTAKKDALTKALAGINDNPFYSEATRTGRIDKLNEQAGNEISDIEDQLNMRKADAQLKVNIATQQYNIDDNNYKNNLAKLNLLITSGALLNASSQDIAQIALATGMSTNMVVGMQNQMQQNLINPQVITSTDNAGNVVVSVIDGSTGATISQNSLGNIGKADKPTSNTSDYKQGGDLYREAVIATTSDMNSVKNKDDKYVHPDNYRLFKSQWVALGLNPDDFDNSFSGFINPSHPQDYSLKYAKSSSDVVIN